MKNIMDTQVKFIDEYNKIYMYTAPYCLFVQVAFFHSSGCAKNDFWVVLNDFIPLLTRFI